MANELTKRVMARIVERSGRTYHQAEAVSTVSCRPESGKSHLTEKEVSHLSGLLHKQAHSNAAGYPSEVKDGRSRTTGTPEKGAVTVSLPNTGGRLKLDDLVRQVKK